MSTVYFQVWAVAGYRDPMLLGSVPLRSGKLAPKQLIAGLKNYDFIPRTSPKNYRVEPAPKERLHVFVEGLALPMFELVPE